MTNSCQCKTCKAACSHKPGWFIPLEIKRAANHLGLSEKEFFQKYLMIDYKIGNPSQGESNIFLLSPAIKEAESGTIFPLKPVGECVFFNDGICDIHTVKPYECYASHHDDEDLLTITRHDEISNEWVNYQDYVKELYGGDLEIPEPTLSDSLYFWLLNGATINPK